jgi:hypothetical protein
MRANEKNAGWVQRLHRSLSFKQQFVHIKVRYVQFRLPSIPFAIWKKAFRGSFSLIDSYFD